MGEGGWIGMKLMPRSRQWVAFLVLRFGVKGTRLNGFWLALAKKVLGSRKPPKFAVYHLLSKTRHICMYVKCNIYISTMSRLGLVAMRLQARMRRFQGKPLSHFPWYFAIV